MFVNVDIVGLDAVCKMIAQTELKKFIIYMQGSGKGSIPKYECTNTTNNSQAIKCFRDWATNILMYNANNAQCYDILLFNTVGDIDEINKRTDKVRFSFALSNTMQNFGQQHNQTPQIDLAAEISKGIEMALLKKEVEELRAFKKENEEEEDDDEEQPDIFDKISGMMAQMKADKISGDLDDNQVMNDKVNTTFTEEEKAKKLANQKKALKILWGKNKKLDEDLLRLATMAQKEPEIFKLTIQKLRDMVPTPNVI